MQTPRLHTLKVAFTKQDMTSIHPKKNKLIPMKTFAKWLFPLCGALLAMGAQAQRRTLIFDNDGSELLLNTYWNEQPLTLWQLDSLVDIQRDTQVGTYAICAGSDFFFRVNRTLVRCFNPRSRAGSDMFQMPTEAV